jgi:hypothetical protein
LSNRNGARFAEWSHGYAMGIISRLASATLNQNSCVIHHYKMANRRLEVIFIFCRLSDECDEEAHPQKHAGSMARMASMNRPT